VCERSPSLPVFILRRTPQAKRIAPKDLREAFYGLTLKKDRPRLKTLSLISVLLFYLTIEEYTALRDQWIRDGEGFLVVYSITSRATFDRVQGFRDQIVRVKDAQDNEIPMMLVGNKSDKVTEREISRDEGAAMARKMHCEFIETSAKTCVNVERSFYNVVKLIRSQRDGQRKQKKGKCNLM
jgi:GTPase SAR1 family protein